MLNVRLIITSNQIIGLVIRYSFQDHLTSFPAVHLGFESGKRSSFNVVFAPDSCKASSL